MLLLIDNYDSFTYNLYQYFQELGEEVVVWRNDRLSFDQIRSLAPKLIVISPGPRDPAHAGISNAVLREFGPTTPTLGVCLGHQCIGHTFGGTVKRAGELVHGKTSPIYHRGLGVMRDLPNPFLATRYHSLVVDRHSLPDCLEITAETASGLVMGLRHRHYPIEGVQFHPESILTTVGKDLLRNFLQNGRAQ